MNEPDTINETSGISENTYSNEDLGFLFKRAARQMIRGHHFKGPGRHGPHAGPHGPHGMHGPDNPHGPHGHHGPHDPEAPHFGSPGGGPHGQGPVHGLPHPAQGRILSILKEKGTMNRKELLDLLDVRSGSLSELLGKLERHGFINRIQDENDKRGFVIVLTEEGEAIVEEHARWRAEMSEALFAPLSDEERKQLGDILTRLAAAWEKASAEAEDAPREGRCGHGRHGGMRGCGRGRGHCHGRGEERSVFPHEREQHFREESGEDADL